MGKKRAEKLGYKIREAQIEKVPYMLVVGDKEEEMQNISVRSRDSGDMGTMSNQEFISIVLKEIEQKSSN